MSWNLTVRAGKLTRVICYIKPHRRNMSSNEQTPIIKLPQGQIKGIAKQTIYDQPYYSFEGIPYAKPPLGTLRFRAPEPAEPWTGVRDCTKFDIQPLQKRAEDNVIEGCEDCLYISVFCKTLQSEKPLPVLVSIYGGSFETGCARSCRYGPDYFMMHNVVLVAFNYRLGVLGFLRFYDQELRIPGNAGLKDQVLAIKWVKNNICYFNGDPNNITIFGMSAGGASAHIMMLTAQTRDLFQRAIIMSGCALAYWIDMPKYDAAYRLAQYHGYKGENNDKLVLEYLDKLEPKKLVDLNIINEDERNNGDLLSFSPVVESYVGDDCVIPEPLIKMLRTTWSNNIPMILGGTTDEGLIIYPYLNKFPNMMNAVAKNPELVLLRSIRETLNEEEQKEMSAKIIQLHFGKKKPNRKAIMKFIDLYTHKAFWHDLHRTALARINYATANTYLYRFAFDSPFFNHHRFRYCGEHVKIGVAHADDLSYIFLLRESKRLAADTPEYKTIERMTGIFRSFATNSDPNCEEIKPAIWKPLQKDNPYMAMNIARQMTFMEMPERAKFEVWNSLYKYLDLY